MKEFMPKISGHETVTDRMHILLSDMGFPLHGRMKQAMQEFGWTESQAGKTLRGEQSPTTEMLVQLCIDYSTNLNWLLCGIGPMTVKESIEDREIEALVWETVNQVLIEEGLNLGNAKRVMIYRFAKRTYERTNNVDIDSIRDFILSTNK